MGAAAVPLILAAAKAGVDKVNADNVERKRQEELTKQLLQQASRQKESDAAVTDALAQRQASSSADEVANTTGNYLNQVRAAQQKATAGLGQVGAVSDTYRNAANDAALGVADYGANSARLMARIDAPVQQRQREAIDMNNLQTALSVIRGNAATDDYLARLRLSRVRSDPWLQAASGLLGGASQATAGSGGFDFGGGGYGDSAALFGSASDAIGNTNADIFNSLQRKWGYA